MSSRASRAVTEVSSAWSGTFAIDHAVMVDAIDVEPVRAALARLGLGGAGQLAPEQRTQLVALLGKAEASHDGRLLEHRRMGAVLEDDLTRAGDTVYERRTDRVGRHIVPATDDDDSFAWLESEGAPGAATYRLYVLAGDDLSQPPDTVMLSCRERVDGPLPPQGVTVIDAAGTHTVNLPTA